MEAIMVARESYFKTKTCYNIPFWFEFKKWSSAVNPYSAGTVCRRQILTTKVGPGPVRVKIFLMALDP